VLLFQNVFTVGALCSAFFWTLRFGSKKDVVRWVTIVPALYGGMLVSSSIAQVYATLGLQIVVRNLAPLIALPVERVMNEPIVIDVWTVAAMFTVLLGVGFYVIENMGGAPYHVENEKRQSMRDLAPGVVLMLLNMVIAIFERIYQRKLIAIEKVDISKTGMLLLNNAFSMAPVALVGLLPPIGDYNWDKLQYWGTSGPHARAAGDWVLLVLSGVTGLAIGWTAINAQQYVTATTMLLITNLNKVVVIAIGMIFMKEPNGYFAIIGCVIALGGGVWYALARKAVAERQKAEKANAESNVGTKTTSVASKV